MVPHYELRCPLHGRVKDLPANVRAIEQRERCPFTRDDVRCAQPLFVAEAMTDHRQAQGRVELLACVRRDSKGLREA